VAQEEERRGGKKGRLLGIITLSDVLSCLIGEAGLEAPTRSESLASAMDERLAPVRELAGTAPPTAAGGESAKGEAVQDAPQGDGIEEEA
jgi:hypothetical protein